MRKALAALALLTLLLHPHPLYAADVESESHNVTAAVSLATTEVASGTCAIRLTGTDNAVEVPDNMPGTQDVSIRPARHSDAQTFELLLLAQDEYAIRTKSSGGYLVESDSKPGSPVQQYGEGAYRGENAVWTPVAIDTGIGFRNKESQLLMTVSDDDSLVVEDYGQGGAQSFACDSASLDIEDGWYFIQGPTGRVLSVCDGIAAEGQDVSLRIKGTTSWRNKHQRFFVQSSDDESLTIASCDARFVLDIHTASRHTKGNLHISERTDSPTQRFRLHIGDNGYYEIENVGSGKYVDVNECSSRSCMSIQQCTASHSSAQQFRLVPTSSPTTKGDDIAHAAVELACSVDERLYADDPAQRIYNAATQTYVDARERLMDPVGTSWEDPPGEYASCDVGVATAVRYSHVDDAFEYRTIINQWPYLRDHFTNIGTYVRGGDDSALKPGDILISDTHIAIWTGNEAVRKRFPESSANLYEAGYSPTFYPSLVCAATFDDALMGTEFTVFRAEE